MEKIKFRLLIGDGIFRYFDLTNIYRSLSSEEVKCVQQYIGLKDKNGVEIYEGDIVRLFDDPDELFEVVYNDYHDAKRPCFVLEGVGDCRGYGDWFSDKDREVIGTIYENI